MGRTVTRSTALAVVPEVETADGELVEELTKDEAEEVTRLLVGCLKNWHSFGTRVTELALKAYYGQAFRALGFASWDAYAKATFGELELPRSTQAAIHAALVNDAEISARSAAAITGADHKTVSKDARKATGEDSPVGKTRTGADGKKRAATKPVKPAVDPADNVTPIRPEPEPPPREDAERQQDSPIPEPQQKAQVQSWAPSPEYLGLGWQNVAEALGNLMATGEPKLSKRARQKVEARLREALDFIAHEARQ